jgi:sulfatase maturation enzyme AslB (radical SAM superfamily)
MSKIATSSNAISYTSASVFPAKLLKRRVIDCDNNIIPVHIQISPTNKCNLKCPFCSYKNVDKNQELDFDLVCKFLHEAKALETAAITITGGGEPLLYPYIRQMVELISNFGLQVSLTTNGTEINKFDNEFFNNFTWIRMSFSCYRSCTSELFDNIEKFLGNYKGTLGFSYVLTDKYSFSSIESVINACRNSACKYIRIVDDICNSNVVLSKDFKKFIEDKAGNDVNIIFQGRKEFVHGKKRCLISLLKPYLGADGYLYGCCGTSYATKEMTLHYGGKEMQLGHMTKFRDIILNQEYFDGSICYRCFYDSYNQALEILTSNTEHINFV